MMLFRKFHVKKDERALLFDRGDFVDILRPGEHLRFDPLRRLTVEKFGRGAPPFEPRLAEFLVKAEPALVEREFHVVELGPAEVGLRFENGVLARRCWRRTPAACTGRASSRRCLNASTSRPTSPSSRSSRRSSWPWARPASRRNSPVPTRSASRCRSSTSASSTQPA